MLVNFQSIQNLDSSHFEISYIVLSPLLSRSSHISSRISFYAKGDCPIMRSVLNLTRLPFPGIQYRFWEKNHNPLIHNCHGSVLLLLFVFCRFLSFAFGIYLCFIVLLTGWLGSLWCFHSILHPRAVLARSRSRI